MQIEQIGNLAHTIMSQYGLIKKGWKIKYLDDPDNNAICNYTKRFIGLSNILLPHLKLATIKDIIIHEVAHALTPGHKHNNIWRNKFLSMGGSGKETYRLQDCIKDQDSYKKIAPYVYVCTSCKNIIPDFEVDEEIQSCAICSPTKFDPEFLLIREKC